MKSLIVGMGIGQLYKTVLTELGHDIVTVDADKNKNADFETIDQAILVHKHFDTAHICTPNFTHFDLTTRAARASKIVFVEKPGVAAALNWATLVHTFKDTRFMMVKNNMWRDNIQQLKQSALDSNKVNLLWHNRDRVPNPGTWFTTKKLSFGGVSRDLMPHLLSLYIALNSDWIEESMTGKGSDRKWNLEDLTQTDYGIVKADGVYDVDDHCYIDFGTKWHLSADWRTNQTDDRSIKFEKSDGTTETFELGLCPESAYKSMIADALANLNNENFWRQQLVYDYWIHERVENL